MTTGKHLWPLMLTLCMGLLGHLSAQSYYNSPGDSIEQSTTLGAHAIVMNITQVHPGNDTLLFHWHKLSEALPQGWTASLCDNGQCYDSLMTQGMMVPIVPGDAGLMSIHCTADTTAGTAVIRYTLYEEKTPSQVDTLTWIVSAAPSGIANIQTAKPKINCASGMLSVTVADHSFDKIEVYDISGRLLMQKELNQNEMQCKAPDAKILIVKLSGTSGSFVQKVINQ